MKSSASLSEVAMPRRVKILLACTALGVGGTETYIRDMVRTCTSQYDIHVLCKSMQKGALEAEVLAQNAEVHHLQIGFANPVAFLRLVWFFLQGRYDSVCDFNGSFAGLTMVAAYLARIPRRVAFHRQSREFFEPSWYRNLYLTITRRAVLRFATEILSNSKAALSRAYSPEAAKNRTLRVIYNGLPEPARSLARATRWQPGGYSANGRRFRIATVGRGVASKNHVLLVKALKGMVALGLDVELLLVGRGIEPLVGSEIDSNIADRVIFLGERADIPELLTNVDVFAFPSLSEGQPNALLEAISAGCECVASNLPEIQETVEWLGLEMVLLNPSDEAAWVTEFSRIFWAGNAPAHPDLERIIKSHSRHAQIRSIFSLLGGDSALASTCAGV